MGWVLWHPHTATHAHLGTAHTWIELLVVFCTMVAPESAVNKTNMAAGLMSPRDYWQGGGVEMHKLNNQTELSETVKVL